MSRGSGAAVLRAGALSCALAMLVASAAGGGGPFATATLGIDPAFLAGADGAGRVKVFTPNPLQPSSSVHHWTRLTEPNLLMDPGAVSAFGDDVDLTDEALADTGWPLGGGATIVVISADAPGEGFNDPSPPVLPAPGNLGATLGAQRLAAVQAAADLWAAILQSAVTIEITASFDSLPPCSPAGGTFAGFGGPQTTHANFAGALATDTWYPQALANALAGADQSAVEDVFNLYNSDVDAACLGPGTGFYYGLDHAAPSGRIDLLQLAMHEIAHGLGFLSLADASTGAFAGPPFFPDSYSSRLLDTTSGLHWDEMPSDGARQASAINNNRVVFDGAAVTAEAPSVLANRTALIVTTPAAIAGSYEGTTANFGAPLASPGISAGLACAFDGAGVSSTDACEPLVNAAQVAGNVVLVDRGTCTFAQKAANVQAAGGVGMVAINNAPGDPVPMAGPGPGVTIPLLMLSQVDGNAIRVAACGAGGALAIPATEAGGLVALAALLALVGAALLRRRAA